MTSDVDASDWFHVASLSVIDRSVVQSVIFVYNGVLLPF